MIAEALKPSEYRKFVKNWDSGRYEDIFQSGDWKTDRRAFRIYLPLKKSHKPVDHIPVEIQNAVSDRGYEIQDYKKGIAKQKAGKRVVKIGKLLPPDLIQQFANDPDRQAQDDYMVVISRHPYDIAGMSTGRGWTSCLNLTDCNSHYVPAEIQQGVIVAYLAKTSDPDLKSPVGRVSIKPFIEIKTKKVFFGVSTEVYGTNVPGFVETVVDWADQVNESRKTNDMLIALLAPDVYPDETPKSMIIRSSEDEQIEAVKENPYLIKSWYSWFGSQRPSETLELVAVSEEPMVIKYIKNPSEEVQLAAVERDAYAIRHIKNPTEKTQIAAIRKNLNSFQFLADRASDRVQIYAIMATETGWSALNLIKRPSEQVQIAAVKHHSDAIKYIKRPTAAVRQLANELWGDQ